MELTASGKPDRKSTDSVLGVAVLSLVLQLLALPVLFAVISQLGARDDGARLQRLNNSRERSPHEKSRAPVVLSNV